MQYTRLVLVASQCKLVSDLVTRVQFTDSNHLCIFLTQHNIQLGKVQCMYFIVLNIKLQK